jgi:protocatechuate 3,4-dioxygenase beta subunit
MRALPFFLVLLVVALALWFVQSGREGEPDALAPRAGAPPADASGPGALTGEPPGERSGAHVAGDRPPDVPSRTAPLAVSATVRDDTGVPVAGARVTLALGSGSDASFAVVGATDATGRAAREVALGRALAPAARHGLAWRVEAWAPGHRTGRVDGALDGAAGIEATLTLAAGATLRGRVVDGAGAAVAGARVSARARTSAGGLQDPFAEGELTDADGRFALACLPGRQGALHALDARGAALVHPLDLGRDQDVGDVALAPLGTLAGRAVYPDGTPARHATISAQYQVFDPEGAADVQRAQRDEHRRATLETVRAGRLFARTTTGDDGRFAFAGLWPGRYRVQLELLGADPEARDAARVHATPTDDVEVRVEVARLVVEVRGARGAPAPGLDVTCRQLDAAGVPVDEDVLGASARQVTAGERGRAAFAVVPGRRYVLAVHGFGAYAREFEVAPPEGAYEHLRTLTLPAAGALGELAVDLRDADGRACGGWRATLLGRRLAHPVAGWSARAPDADGVLRGVPAGDWLVEVAPPRDADPRNFVWLPEPRVAVTVAAGERALVALQGARGARVRVELDATALADVAPLAGDLLANEARLAREGVWVWLEPADGGAWIPVYSLDAAVSPEPQRRALPGRVVDGGGALPPGAYTLLISGPTVRQHREPVTLSAGLVTELRVALQPR